jgi:hypothetical protein
MARVGAGETAALAGRCEKLALCFTRSERVRELRELTLQSDAHRSAAPS